MKSLKNYKGSEDYLDKYLKQLGYKRFDQEYMNSDWQYWKTFKNYIEKLYCCGVIVYDFRKHDIPHKAISCMFVCMILDDDRIDLVVSKDISVNEFEIMSKKFYEYYLSLNK